MNDDPDSLDSILSLTAARTPYGSTMRLGFGKAIVNKEA